MSILTPIHSWDSKIRRVKELQRQINLASKMFESTVKTWEDGIKHASLPDGSIVGLTSLMAQLRTDTQARMTEYASIAAKVVTCAIDLEIVVPLVIKPGEPYFFSSLSITQSSGAILATFDILPDATSNNRTMKGPFYDMAVGDVIKISNAENSANNVYGTIASLQPATGPDIADMGITIGAITGGVTNTSDTKMTITKVQDIT